MRRGLDDVAHFFLGDVNSTGHASPPPLPAQHRQSRSRNIVVTGMGDQVTGAMVVCGLAATAAHLGQRVLVVQSHEQQFGVGFGLGCRSRGARHPSGVTAAPNVRVSPRPLIGRQYPGVVCDHEAITQWERWVGESDLVLVHVNEIDDGSVFQAFPIPDECVVIAHETRFEHLVPLYRTIKRSVERNPDVAVRLITVGTDACTTGVSRELGLAIEKFLGRRLTVAGTIPNVHELLAAFLSGEFLAQGRQEIPRAFTPIIARWWPSETDARITPRPPPQPVARSGVSKAAGRQLANGPTES